MPSASLSDLFSRPAFIVLFISFILALINVFVGINIHPQNKIQISHRYLYYAVMVGYAIFLCINYSQSNWFEYAVLLYWLIVVPWSKGVNVTKHAILSALGLVLLVWVVIRLL